MPSWALGSPAAVTAQATGRQFSCPMRLRVGVICTCLLSVRFGSGRSEPVEAAGFHGLRFVVHKGTEGLGDRLQQLLMVLRYARATGRALVLDWRDPKFARDGGFNFEDFFRLRKVPVFNSNEFLFIWRRLQHHLQVRPAMFRHHLDVITEAHWNFLKFPENNTRMNAIANGDAEDYSEEVVVFAGDQHRYYHYEEIVNLRLRRWMADKVRADPSGKCSVTELGFVLGVLCRFWALALAAAQVGTCFGKDSRRRTTWWCTCEAETNPGSVRHVVFMWYRMSCF